MRVAALLAVGLVLSGCAVGGSKTTTVTVTRTVKTPSGLKKPPAAQAETALVKYFGIPVKPATKLDQCPTSVASKGIDFSCYALTITPKFFLVGVTANVAFAASQGNACQPLECSPVEDDRYVIPAGTQPLTFILPGPTTGTVLTLHSEQMRTTTIAGAQLAAIVGGASTPKLVEPLTASGLWLTVNVDTVTSFAQQFQP
ncbi:MAG TPA: hypothetical protein VGH79_07535 [Gaiellaceae bacterium]|jgi:hypothetical protein